MRAMRTIVVPLDGSEFAESALPMALDIARRTRARVVLVTVYTPGFPTVGGQGVPMHDPGFDREQRDDLRTYLDIVRHRVAGAAADVPGVDTVVLEGPVAPAIAEHAAEVDADLVVLASHGRGGVSRLWLGSVADALVRRLDAPLLVVRPGAGPTPSSGTFRHVLVPIDVAPESELGADTAAAVVGTSGVEYTLLRVVPPMPQLLSGLVSTERVEEDAAYQRDLALGNTAAVERRLRERGADVHSVVRFHDSPAEAILAYARETTTDLIALATHGRGPIGRFLLGSVADKLLRAATVPVLVRHAGERRGGGAAEVASEQRVTVPTDAPGVKAFPGAVATASGG
jgi:nucleotide-binding universal stress UspA family protein